LTNQNKFHSKNSFFGKNLALTIAEFRLYLTLRMGMIFGLNMQSTILYYWVYDYTGSKLSLGLVGLAEVIPAIGCSFFSGHAVDESRKRRMVTICLMGYLITAFLLYGLASPKTLNWIESNTVMLLVYSLVFIGGVLRAFYSPAMFALFGLIVPRNNYANATSWSSMAWQIGAVLGPIVGGFFIAFFGISNSLLAVAIGFIFLSIPLMRISEKPILKKDKEPILKSVREGLQFVWRTPELLNAQLLDMFSVLFGGAVALLPVYQKEILKVGEMEFGLLRAAPGIGALVTMAFLAFIPLRQQPGRKLFLCVAGFAISIIVFGLSTNFYLSLVMLLFSGMFDAVSVVIRSTILQLLTPDTMRGRVAAVNTMFVSSSNELGDFESGVMAHYFGTVRAVVTGGCITLGIVVFTYFKAKKLREFNFRDHE
jgi:MFS family permease